VFSSKDYFFFYLRYSKQLYRIEGGDFSDKVNIKIRSAYIITLRLTDTACARFTQYRFLFRKPNSAVFDGLPLT